MVTDCPVSYTIISNCSQCPPTTDMMTVTCSNFQLSSEDMICEFRAHSTVCGDFVSSASNSVVAKLKGMIIAIPILHAM